MTWLIANWKMHGNAAQVRAYGFALNQLLRTTTDLRVVFCPPALYLSEAKMMLPLNASLFLGAQNCHAAASGAFTGEISASMLADVGVTHVILGHSERRGMGESDADILCKAEAAIAAGLMPILCIGESHAQYTAGKTAEVLTSQLTGIQELPGGRYLIAYEPVWAIGTGLTPKMSEISAAHTHIKSVLGRKVDVLYGGSVNTGNLGEILSLPEVAGALIGGASLEIENMSAMIVIAAEK